MSQGRKSPIALPGTLLVKEVSEILGMSTASVLRFCRRGDIPTRKIGSTYYIEKSWMDKMMNSPENANTHPAIDG